MCVANHSILRLRTTVIRKVTNPHVDQEVRMKIFAFIANTQDHSIKFLFHTFANKLGHTRAWRGVANTRAQGRRNIHDDFSRQSQEALTELKDREGKKCHKS